MFFGSGFPLKHIPSFSWEEAKALKLSDWKKQFEVGQKNDGAQRINLDETVNPF